MFRHSFWTTFSFSVLLILATAGYFSLFLWADDQEAEVVVRRADAECERWGGEVIQWSDGGPRECQLADGTSCGLNVKRGTWACPTMANRLSRELSAEDISREKAAAAALPRPRVSAPLSTRLLGTYRGRQVELAYVCFGDVCPDNGGYFVRYVGIDSQEACEAMGGEPILGTSWGVVYGGCGIRAEAAE